MKNYKSKRGFYRGQMLPAIAKANDVVEVSENEDVYVTADNEIVVSDAAIKGALLLSERPTPQHENIGGEWVKEKAKPAVDPIEALTLRVEALEESLKRA